MMMLLLLVTFAFVGFPSFFQGLSWDSWVVFLRDHSLQLYRDISYENGKKKKKKKGIRESLKGIVDL